MADIKRRPWWGRAGFWLSILLPLPLGFAFFALADWFVTVYLGVDQLSPLHADIISAMISAFAFAGLITAIYLQRRELEEQRRELQLTRRVVKGQREEMKQQNRTMRQQRFESTFFQLLSFWRESADRVHVTFGGSTAFNGKAAFAQFTSQATQRLGIREDEASRPGALEKRLNRQYSAIVAAPNTDFRPYLRILEQLLRLIDESEIEDPQFYREIVGAQLSADEKTLVWMHYMHSSTTNKFRSRANAAQLLSDWKPHESIEQRYRPLWNERSASQVQAAAHERTGTPPSNA